MIRRFFDLYRLILTAGILLFYADTGHTGGLASDGPGLSNVSYSAEQLFKPLSIIKSRGGHGLVSMHNGYLAIVYSENGGKVGGGISFYDISNPQSPKLVSEIFDDRTHTLREPHGYGRTNASDGDYVALQAVEGVQFWDWSDIHNPIRLSYLKLDGIEASDYHRGAWWLFWQAPYVYVGGSSNGIYIVEAKDPRTPRFIKRLPTNETGGFRIGPIFAIGNLLVATSMNNAGYLTMDISDPEDPILLDATRDKNVPTIYSAMVNGGKIIGAGTGDNQSLHIHDISDPGHITFENKIGDFKNSGGYLSVQDGFVHAGFSDSYIKIDIRDADEYKVVGEGSSGLFDRDEDFAVVLGNIVFVGDDNGIGSALMPHQTAPDTVPPVVNMVHPPDGALNQSLHSRIGLTFTDQIEHRSVTANTFIVRPVGGQPLKGMYSSQTGIVNFAPDSLLQPNTIYEVLIPAGGLKDYAGNPTQSSFISRFSTLGSFTDVFCDIVPTQPVEVGKTETFFVEQLTPGATYTWDFGDGSPLLSGTLAHSPSHSYTEPGHYTVKLMVQAGTTEQRCSVIQTIYSPMTTNHPAATTQILFDDTRGYVWTVNPDNNTVTALDAKSYIKLLEQPVGRKPQTLALAPDGTIWVANQHDATLSIIDGDTGHLLETIPLPYGSMPYGIVFSPNGQAGYVTLEGSGRLLKLDPVSRSVRQTLLVGPTPRGMAVSADSRRVLITRFISPLDHGEVLEVDALTFQIKRTFVLADDPGPDSDVNSRGVPNYLMSVTISPDGRDAWVPSKKDNTGRGLFRDNQSLTFDTTVRAIASKMLADRIDFNDRSFPSAVVFSLLGDYAFVALPGNNMIEVRDVYTGVSVTSIERTGNYPIGLALDPTGNVLFVKNYLSRSIVAYDIRSIVQSRDNTVLKLAEVNTIFQEHLSPSVLKGKKIFHNADDDRMSREGYISCGSCHFDGGQDGRVWDFTDRNEGLRNTTSLSGGRGIGRGRLHWTGNFDEVQDFENDMRLFFGGRGFLDDIIFYEAFRNDPLGTPKAGLNSDLDALSSYVSSLSDVQESPYRAPDGTLTSEAVLGKQVFTEAGCTDCHGGRDFTNSIHGVLHNVGTLQPSSGTRRGKPLRGIDTPTLKGIWQTAPYLHDGAAGTLEDVLGSRNPYDLHGTALNIQQVDQLVAYLKQIDDSEPGFTTEIQAIALNQSIMDVKYNVGESITLEATIAPRGGPVLDVAFYAVLNSEIDSLIAIDRYGEDGWHIYWDNIPGGQHGLYTVATYEDGHTTISPELFIQVANNASITNLTNIGGHTYQIDTLEVGASAYLDLSNQIKDLPSHLMNTLFISTAQEDRNLGEELPITFKIWQETTVFIGYAIQNTQLPGWLADWQSTEEKIITEKVDLTLFQKTFGAGTVALGRNRAVEVPDQEYMYIVIIKPNKLENVLVQGDPSRNGIISNLDAELILQDITGSMSLTGPSLEAADVSGDKKITTYDAALILKYVNKEISCFPVHNTCSSPESGTEPKQSGGAQIFWDIPQPEETNTTISLRMLSSDRPITSVMITIPMGSHDIDIIQIESQISDNWETDYNITDSGVLNIAMAGTTPITSGTLLALHVQDRIDGIDLQGEVWLDGDALNRIFISPANDLPRQFVLRQNFPNPFNASTSIQYLLPEAAAVSIDLFNILGQHVATLIRRTKAAGSYTIQVNTDKMSSGIYFYRLQAGSFTQVKKMIVLK
jgi:DNA-binding beta-propeller fold protein YncE